jgi:hypothetical protein
MTFNIDFSGMDDKLADVLKATEKEVRVSIAKTAALAVTIIHTRTREKSQDKDGNQFKPYSDGYAKFKKKRGAPSRVNLTSTGTTVKGSTRKGKGRLKGNKQGGQMVNRISIVRTEDRGAKAVISVDGRFELEKMQRHVRGAGKLPIRNPMGFTNKEAERLSKITRTRIIAAIQKQGRK